MYKEKMDMLYNLIVMADLNVEKIIETVCLLFLCKDFIECGRSGYRKWGIALIGGAYFFTFMALFQVVEGNSFWINATALAAAFLVCIRIDRKRVRTKLFLFSTFLVVCWMVDSMSLTISYSLAKQIDKKIYSLVGYDVSLLQVYYFISFCGYVLLNLLLNGALLFFIVRIIRKVFVNKQHDVKLQELLFLMIPVANGIVTHSILRVYSDIYENATGFSMYQTHPAVDYLWILYYLIIFASVISIIILYQKIQKKQEEENAAIMLESQVRDMQAHITEVEKLYADIRGVKHDLKNHIEIMNGLYAQGKMEENRQYLQSLYEMVERFDFSIKTGNPITDVIIHEKMSLAREQSIEFICDFFYPADTVINAFDISVILSNALSNAIEAADAGGYVKISSLRNKNAYLITVENSFEGSINIDTVSGLPKTKKSDKKAHGFGLQNMRSIAAKYYGDIQLEQKEHSVIVTVMLLLAV